MSAAYSETDDLSSFGGTYPGQVVSESESERWWQADEGERGPTMLVRRDGRYVRVKRPI